MSSERLEATGASGHGGLHLSPVQWIALVALSLVHVLRLVALPFAAWATRLAARDDDKAVDGGRKPVLFFYSQVAWDEVWQRPQEFALRLARHFEVVFFGPLQMHRRFASGRAPHYRQIVAAGGERLLAVTPTTFSGTYKVGWIHRLNQRLLAWEAMLACPMRPDVVVTNSPFPGWLRGRLSPQLFVYDLMDDFVAFDWAPAGAQATQSRLLEEADLLLAGTGYLARKYGSETKPCRYIASGVALDRWIAGAERMAAEAPNAKSPFGDFPRPHLGYSGSISSRIDAALLDHVATAFAEGVVIMLGPVYGDRADEFRAPNIRLLGNKPPAALPDMIPRFDVGLVPFALNEATRALNPIKVMEYLAAGIPVVSVPLPDVEAEFADVVELAATPEAFVAAIRRILAWSPEERRAHAEAARAKVRERSWQSQGDCFSATIREALSQRGKRDAARGLRAKSASRSLPSSANACSSPPRLSIA